MFQFAGFPPHGYGFTMRWHAAHAGFPHSDIRGSMLMCSSPRLFAAYRVFHRLPVPGHPPCALLCLTSLPPRPVPGRPAFPSSRWRRLLTGHGSKLPGPLAGQSKNGSLCTPAGESAVCILLFFSLACYCFLDLHIVSSIFRWVCAGTSISSARLHLPINDAA